MIAPCVHLNGTSKHELLVQLETAARAVSAAQNALDSATPNLRDYYPLGDDRYRQAIAEHQSRQQRLADVYRELREIHEYIA